MQKLCQAFGTVALWWDTSPWVESSWNLFLKYLQEGQLEISTVSIHCFFGLHLLGTQMQSLLNGKNQVLIMVSCCFLQRVSWVHKTLLATSILQFSSATYLFTFSAILIISLLTTWILPKVNLSMKRSFPLLCAVFPSCRAHKPTSY